ncbi:hypothetical protein AB0O82_32555 [Kitasatospora sp. NPDC088264]|uniref:hypothetical protein n=1 Tax=Kitasatospora sp. NPDC088264 TaxID=3155296 RepID=UPI0034166FE0
MDSAPPVTATDPSADSEAPARVCERPECSNPTPKPKSTGRPKQYCSRSCRSKVDRARAKAREAAAEAAATAAAPEPAAATPPAPAALPEPAAAPDRAAPAAPDPAEDRWDADGRYLLGLTDALRRRLVIFLEETQTGDPAAAFDELARLLPGYRYRIYSAAEDIRDKARWPDLAANERRHQRALERIDLSKIPIFDPTAPVPGIDDQEVPGLAPRGETAAPNREQERPRSASRGETAAADEHQEQPRPVPSETVELSRPAPAALPHQQSDDPLRPPPEPYLRGLGRYDLSRNVAYLLGRGWDMVGWSRAPGLFYVRLNRRPLGWVEHGAGRVDGWAVLVNGSFLVDPDAPARPLVCDTADDAALVVRQAFEEGLIDAADPAHQPS